MLTGRPLPEEEPSWRTGPDCRSFLEYAVSCTSLNLYKNDAVVHACAVCSWQYRLIGGGGYASDSPTLVEKKLCSTMCGYLCIML